MDKINLYYKDGKSDKVYHAQIEEKDGGYIVPFQYGRRGTTLATGVKTKEPVTFAEAQKILASLLKEKVGKGYTEGEDGAIFQTQTLEERFTGNVPQLLNAFPKDDDKKEELLQELLADDDWFMQEKHDGWRTMISKEANNVSASNKKGLSVAIPQSLVDEFKTLTVDGLFDGELIGEKYYIFDLLMLNGESLRDKSVKERLAVLEAINLSSMVTPTFTTTESKTKKFNELKADKKNKREGVVFKKKDAKYVPGRPASGGNQRKYKFMEESTVKVISHSNKKRSIEVGVYNDNQEMVSLGNVTIYANQEIPPIGAIIEIKYMHCFEGGSIYVSSFKHLRPDQDDSDCVLSQIKFKTKTDEEDEE